MNSLPLAVQEASALQSKYDLPLYVYDEDIIRRQYKKLVEAFDESPKLRIHYACKANSNNQILGILADCGAEIDAVSLNEGLLAERSGIPAEQIHFTPNGCLWEEYQQAYERGYQISVDNLQIIEAFATHFPSCHLCIRINPSVKAGGHEKISVGHNRSKFGLPLSDLARVKQLNDEGYIKVCGLHIHTGSDIQSVEAIRKGVNVVLREAAQFVETIQFIDVGGGYKVPYHKEDHRTPMNEIGTWLLSQVDRFDTIHGTSLALVIEPGKYLVSEAGYFLVEVTQTKQLGNKNFVYVNSGFNHFIRPMYYDAYHQIVNLSRPDGPSSMTDIVGYLCETDTFALNRDLPKPEVGDILCFYNAGAYAYTMSSQYNLRERPAEILFSKGQTKLIQKREGFDQLIAGQIFN